MRFCTSIGRVWLLYYSSFILYGYLFLRLQSGVSILSSIIHRILRYDSPNNSLETPLTKAYPIHTSVAKNYTA